jgi:tRNA C32,U32 (ribose-2'-O)-methylase TrmJ
LAAYIESEPQRKAAAVAAQAEKVENLTNEINRLDHAVGGGTNKRRLEDTKYVEESREMIEGVKDAVKEGKYNYIWGDERVGADALE